MLYNLSEDTISAYERDGAVCLRGAIAQEQCSSLVDAAFDYIDSGKIAGPRMDVVESGGRYFMTMNMNRLDDRFRAFAEKSPLPGIAAQLMRVSTIRFYYDQMFLSEPGTVRSTAWHNDLPFWPFEGNDIVSLWVALTPVTPDSSPLQYLAGSHKAGRLYQAVTPRDRQVGLDPILEPCPNYSEPENQTGKRILSWTMAPGDVLAHHPLTAHGAPPNTSTEQRRLAVSLRYLGEDVRYHPRDHVPNKQRFNVIPGEYPADDVELPLVKVR